MSQNNELMKNFDNFVEVIERISHDPNKTIHRLGIEKYC
jgi:DNA-directed RNA polymerase subunit N (RpoN/RPB10)